MTLPKTFTEGEVLTAADLNGALENLDSRAPWPVTSTTRPPHAAGRIIYETDTGISYLSTGTAWRELSRDTAWVEAEAYGGPYVNKTQGARCHVKRMGDVVFVEAYFRPDTGTIAAGNAFTLARVSTPFRPTVARSFPGVRWTSGAATPETADVAFTMQTDGNLQAWTAATSTALRLSAMYRI